MVPRLRGDDSIFGANDCVLAGMTDKRLRLYLRVRPWLERKARNPGKIRGT